MDRSDKRDDERPELDRLLRSDELHRCRGSGRVKYTTDGTTWNTGTSGTTAALSAVACPSSTCYAVGAVVSGSAVVLKSTNGGSTWSPRDERHRERTHRVSGASTPRTCIADGAAGTTLSRRRLTTWTHNGNPMSGPTTAQNATSIALNGATCTSVSCLIGLGIQGDIMVTSLLTVTVNTTSAYGTTPE